ncbi:molybdopterin cofactor-binding domain-containing protein [Pseudooceanicola sp.]|uniref:molybdopterin cofactor-binding domain-containing protein n=1 Tax=Pseudooceanicola sp. TaxID=1914328 RepID=UPI003442954A
MVFLHPCSQRRALRRFWTTITYPHAFRVVVARIFGLNSDEIRAITPDVGGPFGLMSFPPREA